MGAVPQLPAARTGLRIGLACAAAGLAAGTGGVLLTLLLHAVQHLAFGYRTGDFLAGAERASPGRRWLAVTVGAALTGGGWWALRRRPGTPPPLTGALQHRRLRARQVLPDAALQVAAVGTGVAVGREGAARLVGAAAGQWAARRAGLPDRHGAVLLAAGAGAGLAAVYDVPVGGAVFATATLLGSTAPAVLAPALLAAGLATLVRVAVLGSGASYRLPPLHVSGAALPRLVLLAALLGVAGRAVGAGFGALTAAAGRRGTRVTAASWGTAAAAAGAAGAALGGLAALSPAVLGNGRGPTQLALAAGLPAGQAGTVLLLRPLVTAGCLAAGVRGGLLTPALSTGALLGTVTATLLLALGPAGGPASGPTGGLAGGAPGSRTAVLAGGALLGAAAVLAGSHRSAVGAVALSVDLTRPPAALAALAAVTVAAGALAGRLAGPTTGARRPARAGRRVPHRRR